jgi:hypothetical protein
MGVHPCDPSPVRRDPDGNVRGTGQKKAGRGQSNIQPSKTSHAAHMADNRYTTAARRVSGTWR